MSDLRRLVGYLRLQASDLVLAGLSAVLAATCMATALSLSKLLTRSLGLAGDATSRPTSTLDPGVSTSQTSALSTAAEHARGSLEALFRPIEEWLLQAPLTRGTLLILALYVAKGLFDYLAEYGMQRVGQKLVAHLRAEVYSQLLRQSDAYFRSKLQGDLMSRITGDTARLQRILGTDIGQLVQSIPVVIAMLTVALLNTWHVTSVCLLAIPLFVLAAGKLGGRVRRSARRSQERAGVLTSLLEETLLARRVVQAFGAEAHEHRRFVATMRAMMRDELRTARANALAPPVMEILAAATFLAVIAFALSLMRVGVVAGGDVAVSLLALGAAFVHVRRLGRIYSSAQQALAAARRVFELLDDTIMVEDPPHPRNLTQFAQSIRLESVTFSYGRGPVLSEVTLEIRKGEVHALVGSSGAGKTTLAMLLPRFIDPDQGRVTIDGVDLRQFQLAALRRQISLVTQETHLFAGSVFENIAYGHATGTMEQVRRAAIAAQADEFIESLPGGYDAQLGERGSSLSAGQRQRIALARAFLKDAPIVVLDEATSALDVESEQRIQLAMERLLVGRTALIIAHRLSTVRRADRIHVVHRGRIVESGRHDVLMQQAGRYARLVSLQTGAESDLEHLSDACGEPSDRSG